MSEDIFAPEVDHLIKIARDSHEVKDDETRSIVMNIFNRLQSVESSGEDQLKEIWIRASRGSIDEFGDYNEYLEAEEVGSYDEFHRLWLAEYPREESWYLFSATIYKDYYSIYINRNLVLQITPQPLSSFWNDNSRLAGWLLHSVDNAISSLKNDDHNEYVKQNLPYRLRFGKILREDYWRIFPDVKKYYLEDINSNEADMFLDLIKKQSLDDPGFRLSEMTVGSYLNCCAMGYKANNYEGVNELSPVELYKKHADGRHEGLLDLDMSSGNAFDLWYHDEKRFGGHPWEVCRGGKSTHISLYACHDDKGWWFVLAGSSIARSIENIKFYLALTENGLPVFLRDGKEIAAMLTGTDQIGIVPDGIFPRYCGSWFTDEKIHTFMNLPYESEEEVIAASYWYPIKETRLI